MTESSFPIVGADFTSGQWSQVLAGLGSGVIDDWGNPYAITLNSNDTATIAVSTVSGVAEAVVAGFGHRLTATVTLSIPAVGSTTTYNIGLLYDPAQASTPVLLKVITGTVTLTTGQVWLQLFTIVRAPSQALTAATLTTPMLKMQPRASAPSQAALLAANPRLYLQGTTVFCVDTSNTFRATLVGSTPTWVGVKTSGTFTPTGIYSAGTPAPVITSMGGRVSMMGLVTSSTATFVSGTTYTIGTITSPAGMNLLPATDQRFVCTSNGTAVAQVVVAAATGTVTIILNVGFTGVLSLSLAGCIWDAQ